MPCPPASGFLGSHAMCPRSLHLHALGSLLSRFLSYPFHPIPISRAVVAQASHASAQQPLQVPSCSHILPMESQRSECSLPIRPHSCTPHHIHVPSDCRQASSMTICSLQGHSGSTPDPWLRLDPQWSGGLLNSSLKPPYCRWICSVLWPPSPGNRRCCPLRSCGHVDFY